MTGAQPTCLLAFDREGIYLGSAELEPDGTWRCWFRGMSDFHAADSWAAAERWLIFGGAAEIKRDTDKRE